MIAEFPTEDFPHPGGNVWWRSATPSPRALCGLGWSGLPLRSMHCFDFGFLGPEGRGGRSKSTFSANLYRRFLDSLNLLFEFPEELADE